MSAKTEDVGVDIEKVDIEFTLPEYRKMSEIEEADTILNFTESEQIAFAVVASNFGMTFAILCAGIGYLMKLSVCCAANALIRFKNKKRGVVLLAAESLLYVFLLGAFASEVYLFYHKNESIFGELKFFDKHNPAIVLAWFLIYQLVVFIQFIEHFFSTRQHLMQCF